MYCEKIRAVARHVVFSLLMLAMVVTARAQDVKPLLSELELRQTAIASVQTLERSAARIFYVESVALLSEYGEWPEETLNWPQDVSVSKLVYDVKNLRTRFLPELVQLRRTASRKGVFTVEEHERFASMLDDLALMIDHSDELYDLIYKHRLGEANLLFHDSIREPYNRIEANGYSIGSGILRDVRRISLAAKKLN